jgi:hypothetical protein
MPISEFDVVTLSTSAIRVMHRNEHHVYEFALIDDGCGRRVVSRGPAIVFGRPGKVAAWGLIADAECAARRAAREFGFTD